MAVAVNAQGWAVYRERPWMAVAVNAQEWAVYRERPWMAVAVNAQEWAVYRERQGTMYRMYKCRGSALIKA